MNLGLHRLVCAPPFSGGASCLNRHRTLSISFSGFGFVAIRNEAPRSNLLHRALLINLRPVFIDGPLIRVADPAVSQLPGEQAAPKVSTHDLIVIKVADGSPINRGPSVGAVSDHRVVAAVHV